MKRKKLFVFGTAGALGLVLALGALIPQAAYNIGMADNSATPYTITLSATENHYVDGDTQEIVSATGGVVTFDYTNAGTRAPILDSDDSWGLLNVGSTMSTSDPIHGITEVSFTSNSLLSTDSYDPDRMILHYGETEALGSKVDVYWSPNVPTIIDLDDFGGKSPNYLAFENYAISSFDIIEIKISYTC